MMDSSDQLLTVAEVARYLGVTPHTVYRWIKQGRLPATRYSPKVIRVRRSDVAEFARRAPGGVAEARVLYQLGPSLGSPEYDAERKEIKRLLDHYSKLSRKPRPKGAPRRGSPEALLEVAGILTKEEGEELRRVIREAKTYSPPVEFK